MSVDPTPRLSQATRRRRATADDAGRPSGPAPRLSASPAAPTDAVFVRLRVGDALRTRAVALAAPGGLLDFSAALAAAHGASLAVGCDPRAAARGCVLRRAGSAVRVFPDAEGRYAVDIGATYDREAIRVAPAAGPRASATAGGAAAEANGRGSRRRTRRRTEAEAGADGSGGSSEGSDTPEESGLEDVESGNGGDEDYE